MIHALHKPYLFLTAIFTLAILLIRAQPSGANNLAPFHSSDCPAPCFMGIRPGVTTDDEALAILEASGQTQNLIYYDNYVWPEARWNWNSAAPAALYSGKRHYDGALGIRAGIVQYIELNTRAMLGETWLEWGAPDWYSHLYRTFGLPGAATPATSFIFVYDDKLILAPVYCPHIRRLWDSDVTVILGNAHAWLEHLIEGYASRIHQPLPRFISETTRGRC